jgi:hypothetical protein
VSKVKSPKQKKQLSLERDRRNGYRKNSKSSRKNIARGKQRRHMDERRAVTQLLGGLKGKIAEQAASDVELRVKVSIADSKSRGFRKLPDEPLGVHLARKKPSNNGATRA